MTSAAMAGDPPGAAGAFSETEPKTERMSSTRSSSHGAGSLAEVTGLIPLIRGVQAMSPNHRCLTADLLLTERRGDQR